MNLPTPHVEGSAPTQHGAGQEHSTLIITVIIITTTTLGVKFQFRPQGEEQCELTFTEYFLNPGWEPG